MRIMEGQYPAVGISHSNYAMRVTLTWGSEFTRRRVTRDLSLDLGPDMVDAVWAARDKHARKYNHGDDFLPREGTRVVLGHVSAGSYVAIFLPTWAVVDSRTSEPTGCKHCGAAGHSVGVGLTPSTHLCDEECGDDTHPRDGRLTDERSGKVGKS